MTLEQLDAVDDVDRKAHRAVLLRDGARDRLPDPERRVGGELEALAVVELLRSADEPDRPLLDEVEERQLAAGAGIAAVALRVVDDEAEVGLDEVALRVEITSLDALGQVHLLLLGEQADAPDRVQERVKPVVAGLIETLLRHGRRIEPDPQGQGKRRLRTR